MHTTSSCATSPRQQDLSRLRRGSASRAPTCRGRGSAATVLAENFARRGTRNRALGIRRGRRQSCSWGLQQTCRNEIGDCRRPVAGVEGAELRCRHTIDCDDDAFAGHGPSNRSTRVIAKIADADLLHSAERSTHGHRDDSPRPARTVRLRSILTGDRGLNQSRCRPRAVPSCGSLKQPVPRAFWRAPPSRSRCPRGLRTHPGGG